MRGVGSSITNDEYVAAGAKILPTADEVWGTGDLILKVKEPIAEEYHRMREGQTLFTYLHLAASKALHRGAARARRDRDRLRDRPAARPLAAAARPDVRGGRPDGAAGGRATLKRANGGRGVLMGGVSGVYAAKVVVIGAGVSGMNAAAIALGMRADVTAAGPRHRAAAPGRRHLPGPHADRRVERVRDRAGGRWTPTW